MSGALVIVDTDPNTHYIRVHRRLLIDWVADKLLEVSTTIGFPQVDKGASISSILSFFLLCHCSWRTFLWRLGSFRDCGMQGFERWFSPSCFSCVCAVDVATCASCLSSHTVLLIHVPVARSGDIAAVDKSLHGRRTGLYPYFTVTVFIGAVFSSGRHLCWRYSNYLQNGHAFLNRPSVLTKENGAREHDCCKTAKSAL